MKQWGDNDGSYSCYYQLIGSDDALIVNIFYLSFVVARVMFRHGSSSETRVVSWYVERKFMEQLRSNGSSLHVTKRCDQWLKNNKIKINDWKSKFRMDAVGAGFFFIKIWSQLQKFGNSCCCQNFRNFEKKIRGHLTRWRLFDPRLFLSVSGVWGGTVNFATRESILETAMGAHTSLEASRKRSGWIEGFVTRV